MNLHELLKLSSSRHDHLCPRQVLGVRMGLAGLKAILAAAKLVNGKHTATTISKAEKLLKQA